MSFKLGPPIASGNEAEVFAWGDKVIKLGKRLGDRSQADRETATLRLLSPLDLAPAVEGVIEVAGRWGIVMERIDLPVLASAASDPGRVPELVGLMVRLHRRIHAVRAPEGVPDLKQRMATRIARATQLDAALQDELLARLEAMPDGDRLCHGDFHPFNILGLDDTARVIDWLDATRGPPAADVCRTYVLISAYDPALASAYVEAYGIAAADIEAWLPLVAAARLAENVPAEFERLTQLARGSPVG